MDPERFQRIMELFETALDLDPDDREAFLDEKCKGDNALREEIEEMLAADKPSDEVLKSLIPENLPEDLSMDRLVGTSLGQYRIERVISSGGMGTVYEALQEKPRRTVAVKVMKEGIASKSLLLRFEYESQILARLRHPNIAQVFEAGTHLFSDMAGSGSGHIVPYFVMEYIPNALPITEYVQQKKLSVKEILTLFMQACEAVHCGHQKGIIHRDLKPANILVDSHGHVQIIDFGVARATDSDLALTTLQTEMGQLIGTLQYMSPEQCKADPHDLDTRSDVYSLGVVLYELLCNKLPYDVRKLSVYDAVQRIRDSQPLRPSTSLRFLKGDTETIVLKALEKDRERRYQSADELRRDIAHYLNDEPIIARPPSMFYQLNVFARRNKALVGGILAAFTAILIGFVVSLSLYFQAEAARSKAAWEAESKRLVNEFFNEMFASIDPMQINIVSGFLIDDGSAQLPPRIFPHDISVEEMIDHAAGRVAEVFRGRPEIEAEVRMRIGLTYRSMGIPLKALPQLKTALQIRLEHLGEDHFDTLCSRIQLAFMGPWTGMATRPEFLPQAEKAYAGMKRIFGDDHPHTLTCASVLATLQWRSGFHQRAETLYRETLKTQERILGKEDRNTLWTRLQWAYHLLLQARLLEAHEQLQSLFDIIGPEGTHPLNENDYIAIFSKAMLGSYHMYMAEYTRAEDLLRDSIARCASILGEDHWVRYGSMWCLAQSLIGERALKEREALLRDALDGFLSNMGHAAWWTFRTEDELCGLLAYQGRHDEVVKINRFMWDAVPPVHDARDLDGVEWLGRLARALMNRGLFEEGEEKCRLWVDLYSRTLGDAAKKTLEVLVTTSDLLFHAGKVKEARAYMERALKGWQRLISSEEADISDLNTYARLLLTCHPEDLRNPKEALTVAIRANQRSDARDHFVLDTLAQAYHLNGKLQEAIKIQQRALLKVAASYNWVDEQEMLMMKNRLLKYLRQSGDTANCMRLLEEINVLEEKYPGKGFFPRAKIRSLLALHMVDDDQYALAEPLARASLDYMYQLPLGISGLRPAEVKSILGFCLAGMNRHEEADSLLKEGFEGLKNNPLVPLEVQQKALERLIQYYENTGDSKEASSWRGQRTEIGLPASEKMEGRK